MPSSPPPAANRDRARVWKRAAIVAGFLLLLAIDVAILDRADAPSLDKVSFVFKLIGFYGIALGFLRKTVGGALAHQIDLLTSPNLLRYIPANLYMLSVPFLTMSLGLGSRRRPGRPMALGCLGQLVLLLTIPFALAYALLHVFVLMPFAYPGYVLSSAVVEAVVGSADDLRLVSSDEEGDGFSARELFAADPVASRIFLVGVPAAVLSFVTELADLFLVR